MATGKRYYWIKLTDNFYKDSDAVDFLMSQENGANYVVLYQILLLMTVNTDGRLSRRLGDMIIPYDAVKIQRTARYFSIDTVRVALELYKNLGLIYEDLDGTLVMTDHDKLVGSETDYAAQKRAQREQLNLPAYGQCPLPVHKNVHTDIDIEKEKDIEIDNNSIRGKTAEKSGRFKPPTEEKVGEYCRERGNGIDPGEFVDYYASIGWAYKNGTKMKDWQAAIRTWERRRGFKPGEPEKKSDTPLPTTTRRNR